MQGLILSLVGAFAGTLVTVLFFSLLYMHKRERYLGIWAAAWIVSLAGLMSMLAALLYKETLLLLFVYELSMFLSSILLLHATHIFFNKKLSPGWVAGSVAAAAWTVAGIAVKAPFLVIYLPSSLYLTATLLLNGKLFLRAAEPGFLGSRIAGWSMILWGLHRLDYLYLQPAMPSFAPWGFLLGTVFVQSAGIGILLEYFALKGHQLSVSEEKYRNLANSLPEVIFEMNTGGRLTFVNRNALRTFGYSDHDLNNGLDIRRLVAERDTEKVWDYIRMSFKGRDSGGIEFDAYKKDGGSFPVVMHANAIVTGGKTVGLRGIIFDITQRKEVEKKLAYLSSCDPLTGVYNRLYFEQEMQWLEKSAQNPVSVIICDLDALKLINDTLGHSTGDKLLVNAAEIIKESLRDSDVVARIGGDEFAVILPGTSRDTVEKICERIMQAVSLYNEANKALPLYLSVGSATNSAHMLSEAFKAADDNMYREKLRRREEARKTVIEAFLKALDEKDFIKENHLQHLLELTGMLADALNFDAAQQKNMRLFAYFHDIGKVGVTDTILLKPGLLTSGETTEMHRHCEIGYRIALAMPELEPVADLILKHHEWWNGEGYPQGLKGEEIPLACRIFALCDAYDAMVNDRPYRKRMPPEEAMVRLDQKAGQQFDPNLVFLFRKLLAASGKVPLK